MNTNGNPAAQIANVFSNFGAQLKPFGSQAVKQFSQMQQYAKERMGSASDVTELPAEYRDLELKVDRIKTLHDNLSKISRNFTLPHYDYEPPLAETALNFASTVSDRAISFTAAGARAAGVNANIGGGPKTKEEIPPSLAHAFARAAIHSAEELGTQEPIGVALKKFATAEERVGNARLKFDAEATSKFHQPINRMVVQNIAAAMKARKSVQSVRLTYDACRARLKAARPEHVEAVRQEMEAAEDEFVAAVDDAMGKMKAVVETTETFKNLADLVSAQLKYFKEAAEALSEVAPELDELTVTNEALLRHPAA
ncbi:uncharacterized protein EV422DRAFT_56989 [Fimicolochytrium jonesii]|uniref:uncharacterized protein n=1 Tax=Fimicolochytrium jonesii TaxID=1396493 RepID=UPI0022FDC77F|nr:uncharacterized protein EV422DRAFT_56989 [Fimicolochytrium jonesii]KAI8820632.1 hypothetical protein EV422DRAFT_56989 [Fimicolochytrium jonesii]